MPVTMWFSRQNMRPRHSDLPADIYVSLVTSLYSDQRTLFLGAFGTVTAALITAWKDSQPLLFACAVAIAFVAFLRIVDMRSFARQRHGIATTQEAARWEFRYVVGASAYILLMGIWVLIAFAMTNDPFVQLLSFSMTLVNMIGVAGRNFGSRRLVAAQLVCAGIPMTAALFIMGNFYYAVFACVLLPFFISFKGIADRLRRTLLNAVVATREVTLLASRFDTALNNMPHGLCMLDADGQVVISNGRLFDIIGLPSDSARSNFPLRNLLRGCVRAGALNAADVGHVAREFDRRLSRSTDEELVLELRDGRTLVLAFQAMHNGGSVVLVEDVTERKVAEAKIQYLARYDALTGLLNRSSFHKQMDRALTANRRKVKAAVLFVDLDEFKQVNDTLGHPVGDMLLCAVADRLRAVVRDTDTVARFGGDEFVVLQCPLDGPDDAAALARRIVETIGGTYEIDGNQVVIGASIGVAMAPGDGQDADLLLKNADMALYRAKSDGKGGWRFFEPDMDVKAQARRNLELDLRAAIANDAFEVHYQPIYDLRTRRVSTCEALLRWPHPERGMISPAEFIPIAEEMGLIVEIGRRVLQKACTECTKWPEDVRVAVNLSPIQFRRGGVLNAVRDALSGAGLHPNRLEIEITESVLLHDTQQTRATLKQLREMGVRISLDDFGTGYSSLSYLHSFPLHKVKIDRSFLQGVETSERSLMLIRGVARLSSDLGLSVVVEGVETEQQLALIAGEHGIDEAQGYLFSPALPGRDIRTLLYAQAPEPLTECVA